LRAIPNEEGMTSLLWHVGNENEESRYSGSRGVKLRSAREYTSMKKSSSHPILTSGRE